MLTLGLVEKVLGILTLISWGSSAYIAIPDVVNMFSHQVPLFIITICLPLFIPLPLLLSEGFWARHVIITTILGWVGGLLATAGGLVLLFLLPAFGVGLSVYHSDSLAYAILVCYIGGMFLLWADAGVIFTRVWRKR